MDSLIKVYLRSFDRINRFPSPAECFRMNQRLFSVDDARHTGVDGGFTRSYGHVGRVGYQRGTFHDGLSDAVDLHGQLGEIAQYLGHLVTTFTATYVDDNVGVGVLGQGLRDDGLAATEGTGNSSGSALDTSATRVEF